MLPGDPAATPHRPFCSLRCKQVDLMRWSKGKYAIAEPRDPTEDTKAAERDESAEE